tara:strand:- start:9604 stop:9990 length:387 start_codon:yes stop_codon:yes gene_type:complete
MDGIFDLFHVGHLDAIKQCSALGDVVVIGVISDEDATSYKRKPIIDQIQRCEIVESCKYVNELIFPAPLYVSREFINDHNIDLVVHGFANGDDLLKQEKLFKNIDLHVINYSDRINTTQIIDKIISNK